MLQDPETIPIIELKDWLCARLGIPPTHTVGVHVLWTKSRIKPDFYLRPIEEQAKWVKWVKSCLHGIVNPSVLVLPMAKDHVYD